MLIMLNFINVDSLWVLLRLQFTLFVVVLMPSVLILCQNYSHRKEKKTLSSYLVYQGYNAADIYVGKSHA